MSSNFYDRGEVKQFGNGKMLGLGEIVRYNNRPKIKNENVAEHSFYVAETVIRLCDLFQVSTITRVKALEFAIVHDIPEIETGDVSYETKVKNPAIRDILAIAEVQAMKDLFPEHLERYEQLLEEEQIGTLAAKIVKLADTISVLTYSNRELILGNSSPEMKRINEDAKARVYKMFEDIKKDRPSTTKSIF